MSRIQIIFVIKTNQKYILNVFGGIKMFLNNVILQAGIWPDDLNVKWPINSKDQRKIARTSNMPLNLPCFRLFVENQGKVDLK